MTDAEMTPGEIQRWLERIDSNIDAMRKEVQDRHHKLSGEVAAVIVPVSTLGLRMGTAEAAIVILQNDMRGVLLKAATLSGAIAFGGFLLGLFWRH
jgi:hypothetical protein